MTKKQVRKPRDLKGDGYTMAHLGTDITIVAGSGMDLISAKDARRFSAWLLKAAEYLEAKEGKA